MLKRPDSETLKKIINFTAFAKKMIMKHRISEQVFYNDATYQLAATQIMGQIGELVKRLSDDFVKENSNVPWKAIARNRDVVVHHYSKLDPTKLWETMKKDFPVLEKECQSILRKNNIYHNPQDINQYISKLSQ